MAKRATTKAPTARPDSPGLEPGPAGAKSPPERPPHTLPKDLREAIDGDAAAKALWADITPLAKNEWICWVTSAKKEETRAKRITVGLDKMRKGMRRPCCWPGCPHR